MNLNRPPQHSQVFLLRIWVESQGDGQPMWQGKVQHLVSGEAHHFEDWSTLIAALLALLPSQPEAESPGLDVPTDQD